MKQTKSFDNRNVDYFLLDEIPIGIDFPPKLDGTIAVKELVEKG